MVSFLFYQGTGNDLNRFVKLLNSMNPDLKSSVEYDHVFFGYVNWIMQW